MRRKQDLILLLVGMLATSCLMSQKQATAFLDDESVTQIGGVVLIGNSTNTGIIVFAINSTTNITITYINITVNMEMMGNDSEPLEIDGINYTGWFSILNDTSNVTSLCITLYPQNISLTVSLVNNNEISVQNENENSNTNQNTNINNLFLDLGNFLTTTSWGITILVILAVSIVVALFLGVHQLGEKNEILRHKYEQA